VTVGFARTCALREDNALFCWGDARYGQLGDGNVEDRFLPARVGTDDWSSLTGGPWHSCGTKTDGTLHCWGHNSAGQLGDGTTEDRDVPTPVGRDTWVTVAAGGDWVTGTPADAAATCGITSAGSLYCWGANEVGQLGIGSNDTHLSPTRVGESSDWLDVSVGGYHACGIRQGGLLFCWGENTYGAVGDGTHVNRTEPTRVAKTSREAMGKVVESWSHVAAGAVHTCALGTAGVPFCWGSSEAGQLGDGYWADQSVPSPVALSP
jgi:alpha-tubulin suppressor-like RCC1 family protein